MYFDTSVVLSLYLEDAFTTQAVDFYAEHAQFATVSDWVDLEGKSALGVLVRSGQITIEKARRVLNEYEADRAEGRYRAVSLGPREFAAGRDALGLGSVLRAGDALHLGTALQARLPLVTSDKNLHRSAVEAGVVSTYLPERRGS
jgi:predicted nucleic acid-binding protein